MVPGELMKTEAEAWPGGPLGSPGGLRGTMAFPQGAALRMGFPFGLDKRVPDISLIKLSTFLQGEGKGEKANSKPSKSPHL